MLPSPYARRETVWDFLGLLVIFIVMTTLFLIPALIYEQWQKYKLKRDGHL